MRAMTLARISNRREARHPKDRAAAAGRHVHLNSRNATREEARRDLYSYIEGYYNRRRLHSALDDITPEQAEFRTA